MARKRERDPFADLDKAVQTIVDDPLFQDFRALKKTIDEITVRVNKLEIEHKKTASVAEAQAIRKEIQGLFTQRDAARNHMRKARATLSDSQKFKDLAHECGGIEEFDRHIKEKFKEWA